MTRVRTLLLVVLGIAVPAALVAGVYLASAGQLTDVPAVVAVPADKVAAPIPTVSETTTTTTGDRGGASDRAGKCDEKEHELDPECDPRGGGSGDGSEARTGGSGSGSDDSGGHGSDGDSSGHSSDGDSSGHGSGGDD
jgi:hypothetical protein